MSSLTPTSNAGNIQTPPHLGVSPAKPAASAVIALRESGSKFQEMHETKRKGDESDVPSSVENPVLIPISEPPSSLIASLAKWNQDKISRELWLNPQTLIGPEMIAKVNFVAEYLERLGFELKGVPADGNCFFHSFLGSYQELSRKIPLLDGQSNKIGYLREAVSAQYEKTPLGSKNGNKIDEIKEDGKWIVAADEGDLLAIFLRIPIRVITVSYVDSTCGISDMLTFEQPNKPRRQWETIFPEEKTQEYIFIVDLGGHFVYARQPTHPHDSKSDLVKESFLVKDPSPKNSPAQKRGPTKLTERASDFSRGLLSTQTHRSDREGVSSTSHLIETYHAYQGRPFFMQDRETRSTLYSPGVMVCRNFNPESGELEAEFTSKEQFQKFYRHLAKTSALHQNYAMAKYYFMKSGTDPEMFEFEWLEKGFRETSKQIKTEGGEEWESVSFKHKADQANKTREKKLQTYEQSINNLKRFFIEKDLDVEEFFKSFHVATTLRSYTFEPHYFSLCLAPSLCLFFPQDAEIIINEAYAQAPILTFNVMLNLLNIQLASLMEPVHQERFRNFFHCFIRRFPEDVAGYMVAKNLPANQILLIPESQAKEDSQRQAFSDSLAQGMTALRRQDLKSARKAFSEAEYYHISDQRPYMYKALIDLKNGDLASALKLLTHLSCSLDWSDEEDVRRYRTQFFKKIMEDENTRIGASSWKETPVLNAILKIYRLEAFDSEAFNQFFHAMQSYLLENLLADLIWADFAVSLVQEKFEIMIDVPAVDQKKYIMNLHLMLCAAAFLRLHYCLGNDLSDYTDFINMEVENCTLIFRPEFQFFWPQIQNAPILISPNTFEIPEDNEQEIYREILWDRYQLFSLYYHLSFANNFDSVLKDLDQLNARAGTVLYEQFVISILKRLDKGNLAQRVRLVKLASRHVTYWPQTQRQALSDSIFRWQLEQPIPCQGIPDLIDAGNSWLAAIGYNAAISNTDLSMAHNAWYLLQNRNLEEARSQIQIFFESWEARLQESVDPIALTILCLVNSLLRDPRIAQAVPLVPKSEVHTQLIHCTFSILAREGVRQPYVVPDHNNSLDVTRNLFRLYMGQRKNETEEKYCQRLEEFRLPNLSDLRQASNVNEDGVKDSSIMKWFFSNIKPTSVRQIAKFIENEIALVRIRATNSKRIQEEKPDYSVDPNFIQWVTGRRNLISDFLKNPQKMTDDFKKNFPNFPQRQRFLDELAEKAKHEVKFFDLVKKTPAVEKDSGKRCWQIVQLTSELINKVLTTKRHEEDYDMILYNEAEAHFVMLLIYEWNLSHYNGAHEKLAEAFHGPEIHIWGNGPRIPHFNAGIYHNKDFVNVHLFFE